ncbi:MAG: hypothetical protein AB1704_20010 [Pseudomonadota bacterium]
MSPASRILAVVVAAIATSSSIAITVLASIERGGTVAERCVWAGIGLALMLSAHLLPAMTRGAGHAVRLVAGILWLAAMASTGYTHGTFFLTAQQHAGDARAAQVSVPAAAPDDVATRSSITALLRLLATVQGAANRAALTKCAEDCRALSIRRQTLRDQMTAITGQLEQARRAEQANDRQAAERAQALSRQDEQRGDPVSKRLSGWIGVPVPTIDLALAIFLGWLLESVACFSWFIALSRSRHDKLPSERLEAAPDRSVVVAKVDTRPTFAIAYATESAAANDPDVLEAVLIDSGEGARDLRAAAALEEKADIVHARTDADDETLLRQALAAGIATNSIADIIRVIGCSEGRALALRRQIATTNPQLLMTNAG